MVDKMLGNVLVLSLEGEINSANAGEIEKEANEKIAAHTFSKLVLDFTNITYVSSAGLRVILKLKQKFDDLTIIEASLVVYDVLSMTGFTDIMEIHKALNRVDVTNAEVVGSGFFSTVYRIDKDTIVKVFNRTSDPDQINRELSLSKQAFILGIPTAISYDTVRVGDKLGVRFEMLDCKSLKAAYQEKVEPYGELTKKYIQLLKTINTTVSTDERIPSMLNQYRDKLEKVKADIGKDAYAKIASLFNNMDDPRTFVHGDCHFKNIMVQGNDLLLIDMDTLSYGNPLFEFSQIYAPYVAFDEDDPGNSLRFFNLPSSFCVGLFMDLLKGYLGKEDVSEELKKIQVAAYLHMMWWTVMNTPENKVRYNGNKKRLLALLPEVNNLNF